MIAERSRNCNRIVQIQMDQPKGEVMDTIAPFLKRFVWYYMPTCAIGNRIRVHYIVKGWDGPGYG